MLPAIPWCTEYGAGPPGAKQHCTKFMQTLKRSALKSILKVVSADARRAAARAESRIRIRRIMCLVLLERITTPRLYSERPGLNNQDEARCQGDHFSYLYC